MKRLTEKSLSQAHKSPPPAERLERNITDLEIEAIEKDLAITDLEIAVLELQQKQ